MRGPSDLDALWERLLPSQEPAPSPISPMQLHLQNQILRREVSDLSDRVQQLGYQVGGLFDAVLKMHPNPKKIQETMRKK